MNRIESCAEYILNEIITDEQKERAAIDVAAGNAAAWNQGRLLIELLDEIGTELPKSATIRAVANLYGLSDVTIKQREKPARMFIPSLVAAHPLLTFSYWRTAAYANHRDTPLESALDIIWQIYGHWEAYGKRPSVQTVESWVRNGSNTIQTVWQMRTEGIASQMEKVQADDTAPQELRDLIGWFRGMLLSYLESGISPLLPPHIELESKRKEVSPAI